MPSQTIPIITEQALAARDASMEARAEAQCSYGVGCGLAGVCYAEAHGQPEQCGRLTEEKRE